MLARAIHALEVANWQRVAANHDPKTAKAPLPPFPKAIRLPGQPDPDLAEPGLTAKLLAFRARTNYDRGAVAS